MDCLGKSFRTDSLNWLAEMNGHPAPDETQVNCMGLATWEWSPPAEQRRLAFQWVSDALTQWQRPLPEKERVTIGGLALNWLAALEPEAIARHCGPGLPSPAAPPSWPYPMPWRMREYFQNNGLGEDDLAAGKTALSKLVQAHRPSPLLDLGEELLDRNPDAGPARLKLLADAIEDGLEVLENRLADREDILAERAGALSAQMQSLQEELERLLSGWPGAGIMSWLRLTTRPWRWPSLVWTYWQLRNLALVIEQIEREKEQWERQQQIAAVTGDLYHSLKGETTLFRSKVEEVADMLGNLGKMVEEELEKAGKSEVTAVLYRQLVEAPGPEAEQAAATIGGLGQQLARPDDIFLESLLEAGLDRMREVLSLSAVDVLLLLYPTPDGLADWWLSQMEAASPLWHSNQGMTPVAEQKELLLVCGSGVLSLKQVWGGQSEGRWLETMELERLIVLRLRGPVAVPVAAQIAMALAQTDEDLSEVNDEL